MERNAAVMGKIRVVLLLIAALASCRRPGSDGQQRCSIGGLSFELPRGWQRDSGQRRPPLEGQVYGDWCGPDGRELHVMMWSQHPILDGGPTVVATEEPIVVAGQETRLVKTSVFFDAKEEALVVHLDEGEATYLVYSKGVLAEDFKRILRSVTFGEQRASGTMVLDYEDFGPQAAAYEVIGFAWYQWQPHGDEQREDDVRVVVYRGMELANVKELFPVSREEKKDHRYLEYSRALSYLRNLVGELEAMKESGRFEDTIVALRRTRQQIVHALGEEQ